MKKLKKEWFAFYTHTNCERRAKENLESKGIEVFLPTKQDRKTWKNGQNIVSERVLFNSYLFVRLTAYEAEYYSRSKHICDCVRSLGKPEVVKDELIDTIRSMIDAGAEVDSDPDLSCGTKVLILNDRLKNCIGYLREQLGKHKFCVEVPGSKANLSVLIDLRNVTIQKLSE